MTDRTPRYTYSSLIKKACIVLAFVCFPSVAFAYNLQCSNGVPVPGTTVFFVNNCNAYGVANVFSGLNCNFQTILNEIIMHMYCGIQFRLKDTLNVAILIFVITYAIMFMLGLSSLTAKELVTRMLKMALIWAFAMNASWGVGLAFYFFVGGIETMVSWVLVAVFNHSATAGGFFLFLDNLIYGQLTGGLTTQGYALLGFFATLFTLMPPVFMLFLIYMITVLAALTRALISYLLGLSAIAFLLSLGPIFFSFALFQSTYTFFDSWLKYMISFAMQIIMIFAALALWIVVMGLFGDFFGQLADRIVPYEKIHSEAAFAFFKSTWGYCPSGKDASGLNCISGLAWPPSAYANDSGFIFYLTVNLLALGIVVYAFDALLRAIPDIARQLSGPKYAPQLGGGHGFGKVTMPGFSGINKLQSGLMSGVLGGASNTLGTIKSKAASLTSEGTTSQSFYQARLAAEQAQKAKGKGKQREQRKATKNLVEKRK